MKVTLLTVTGDRPAAFALCERWMAQQTHKPSRWVVVDHGEGRLVPTMGQDVRFTQSRDLAHNLRSHIHAAAQGADLILFVDDDAYYAPHYVETMVEQAIGDEEPLELVGESNALHYNVGFRMWDAKGNTKYAPLGQSAMRPSLIPALLHACQNTSSPIDTQLWKGTTHKRLFYTGRRVAIGIKGLPGDEHPDAAHITCIKGGYHCDLDLRKLQSLIGKDAAHYYRYFDL